ncbi:DUF6746 family protein [Thiopseudomonas acetoxidans]|uniref:Uncharacterized protein n=1 Tax=Thiopseudomonas acetoxidans TaxID=3041622 RepID=A0ABT7SQ94_9GAMM|nr:DUF6746 family protein [Thiopseudomonas sp. CY1220]MDM7858363.1 hypothetical protein [Thiopseudomonas sp. CY1220]
MKNIFTIAGLTIGLAFASVTFADEERVQHFKGLPAPDLATAVANFSEYNTRLEAKLASKLTDEDLAEIHVLTYTLENALEKIEDELEELAETLEEVHVASETFDREKLKKNGDVYLQVSRTIIK